MNKTRLFVYKAPALSNNKFDVKQTTDGNLYDDRWSLNGAAMTAYGILPAPDNTNRDFAITQDMGVNDSGTFTIGIEIEEGSGATGFYEIGIGNAHTTISTPGKHTIDFVVTAPDPVLGYKFSISASGGSYLGGSVLNGLGLKSVYIVSEETQSFKEIDLYDNIDIPITYNVADVRDISKKDSNWSLTIDIPNTPNNAQVFDCIHEITDYKSNFELLKQYKAFVEVDNNRTFDGYFQLTKVNINDGKEISYEGNLYSSVIEFVKRLGTTTLIGNENSLDDLDFSEYTTQLTNIRIGELTSIDEAGTNPNGVHYGEGFFLSQIDKYDWNKRGLRMYPYSTCQLIGYDELTPCLWYKEIWDKIFEQAHFNYISDFISGTDTSTGFYFPAIAYPSTKLNAETSVFNYSELWQRYTSQPNNGRTTFHNYIPTSSTPSPDTYASDATDIFGHQGEYGLEINEENCGTQTQSYTVWRFTANKSGRYHIRTKIPWSIVGWTVEQFPTPAHIINYTGPVTVNETDVSNNNAFRLKLMGYIGGLSRQLFSQEESVRYDNNTGFTAVNGEFIMKDNLSFEADLDVYLEAGEYLSLDCEFENLLEFYNSSYATTISITQGGVSEGVLQWVDFVFKPLTGADRTLIYITRESDLYYNGTFNPNDILNENTKKIDLINNVIKKFNLYIEDVTGKRDNNGVYYEDYPGIRRGEPILRIEPRNQYYEHNIVRDLTDRVDIGTVNFNRIDDYIYDVIDLKDKYDDDEYYTKSYNSKQYKEGEYGEHKHFSEFNSSFDDVSSINTLIGQTCVGPVNNRLDKKLRSKLLQAPFMVKFDDDFNIQKDVNYSDRMLFAYNVNQTRYPEVWSDYSWAICKKFPDGLVTSLPEIYMLAGEWISLDTFNSGFGKDTADLNFGTCNWYYQNLNNTSPTSNNCYNAFYKNMIDNYNSPNARLMACDMYLKSSDIRDLKLSDVIIVDSVAYHINKIKEWKNGSTPCQVELIKIIDSNSDSNTPVQKSKSNAGISINKQKQVPIIKYDKQSINEQMMAVNKSIESGNVSITELKKMISDIDYRLKKLESGK